MGAEASLTVLPSAEEAERRDLEHCRELLRVGSKSFHAASLLLPKEVRASACALYAFCRVADDAVDDPRAQVGALDRLRERLDRAYAGSPFDGPVDRAFSRLVAKHAIPRALPDALLEGFAWDLEGRRYASLEELRAYAARVASTVGAMMTLLMGVRTPYVLARACDLGVAMQLTNIARDVAEDARNGRVYLPGAWLAEAGLSPQLPPEDLRPSTALEGVLRELLGEADRLYARADLGVGFLPPGARTAIHGARLLYAEIGRVVERRGYDIRNRAVVGKGRKLWLLWRAYLASKQAPVLVEEGSADPRLELALAPPLPETAFLVEAVRRAS